MKLRSSIVVRSVLSLWAFLVFMSTIPNRSGQVEDSRYTAKSAGAVFRQGSTMTEKLGPESLIQADDLSRLGDDAYAHGNLAEAEEYYQRALAIEQQAGSGHLSSSTLVGLA